MSSSSLPQKKSLVWSFYFDVFLLFSHWTNHFLRGLVPIGINTNIFYEEECWYSLPLLSWGDSTVGLCAYYGGKGANVITYGECMGYVVLLYITLNCCCQFFHAVLKYTHYRKRKTSSLFCHNQPILRVSHIDKNTTHTHTHTHTHVHTNTHICRMKDKDC